MDDQNYGNDAGSWLQNPVLTLAEVLVTAAWPWMFRGFDALWWFPGRGWP